MSCGDTYLSWLGDFSVGAVTDAQLARTVVSPAVHLASGHQSTVVSISTADVSYCVVTREESRLSP